jgi:hypothetical protein
MATSKLGEGKRHGSLSKIKLYESAIFLPSHMLDIQCSKVAGHVINLWIHGM